MITPYKLRDTHEPLISAVSCIMTGLITHQEFIGVKQNTYEQFSIAYEALNGKAGQPGSDALYNAAAVELNAKTGSLTLVLRSSRKLARATMNVLKNELGNQMTPAWQAVGFTRSLAIPWDPYGVLSRMASYLEKNPAVEFAAQGVTCLNIRAALQNLANARAARQSALETARTAKERRDQDRTALYQRVVSLRGELRPLLSASDVRWYAFNFPRPIDGRIPAFVADLAAKPLAPGTVELTWAASLRAKEYRVQWHLKATPEHVVSLGLIAERAITLHNLPTGAPIVVLVSAYNKSGETQPATLEVTLA